MHSFVLSNPHPPFAFSKAFLYFGSCILIKNEDLSKFIVCFFICFKFSSGAERKCDKAIVPIVFKNHCNVFEIEACYDDDLSYCSYD